MITFDTSGVANDSGSGVSIPITVGTAPTALMIISLTYSSGDTVPDPTYNGVTGTLLDSTDDGQIAVKVWYINNPTQGVSHNVIIAGSGSTRTATVATYLNTAGISTPNDVKNTGGLASSASLSLTPQRDNSWIGIAVGNGGVTQTATGATTIRQHQAIGFTGVLGDSNGAITPPTSTALGVSWSGGNQHYGIIVFEILAPYSVTVSDTSTNVEKIVAGKRLNVTVADTSVNTDNPAAHRVAVASVKDTTVSSDSISLANIIFGPAFRSISKNISSWVNQVKNSPSVTTSFLLTQDGFHLLRESVDGILLETLTPTGSGWVNSTKH